VLRNVVVIRTPGPMVDMRAHIASDRAFVGIAARDAVIAVVEANLATGAVPEILGLDGMCVSP
jgi:hypothetical protein